jgi:hypothetical protein
VYSSTVSLRILYLLLREGAEWILSSRPSRGGQGPRRDPGGSDAQADRPSRLPSVFLNCHMVAGGTPSGSSAEGASKPLEPGREASMRVSCLEPGAKPLGE